MWIPPVTSETLSDAQNIVNTMKALCDAIEESGGCRDFLFFWDNVWDLKKEFREKTRALDTQVRGAKIAAGHLRAKCINTKRLGADLTKSKRPKT